MAKTILLWCHTTATRILCRDIPGRLNIKADQLSCRSQVVGTKWSLSPRVVEAIWALWDRPYIDLFATRDNCKLPTFMSPFLDEMALAMDTMSISWKGRWAYAFHLFTLVPKVLAKISEELVEIVLVVLWWPRRVWSLELLELSVEPPRELPLLEKLLLLLRSNIYHRNSQASHLKTIAKGIRYARFSKDMAERVARGKLRQSSLKVYDSR